LDTQAENIVDFTIIYNKYKKRLYNYILKMCMDSMVAEDITQNVFIKFYQNQDKIKNKKSVPFWLFKTARNEFYSLLRNSKIRKLYSEAEELEGLEIENENSIAEDFEKKELEEIVREELDKVNPINKEIFVLKEYSGFSYKEIGSIIQLDIESVKSRLYKLRQKLIKKISKIV